MLLVVAAGQQLLVQLALMVKVALVAVDILGQLLEIYIVAVAVAVFCFQD
jgi:hypothetical protein